MKMDCYVLTLIDPTCGELMFTACFSTKEKAVERALQDYREILQEESAMNNDIENKTDEVKSALMEDETYCLDTHDTLYCINYCKIDGNK
jgi:hypothetical protein